MTPDRSFALMKKMIFLFRLLSWLNHVHSGAQISGQSQPKFSESWRYTWTRSGRALAVLAKSTSLSFQLNAMHLDLQMQAFGIGQNADSIDQQSIGLLTTGLMVVTLRVALGAMSWGSAKQREYFCSERMLSGFCMQTCISISGCKANRLSSWLSEQT